MAKLIEGYASRLEVPAGARDVQVFDDELRGFGIRKFASGRAFFFVKYSLGAKQRKMSLGPVVKGVLAEKRRLASDILSRARIGQDVAADKQAAKDASTRKVVTLGALVPKYLAGRKDELREATLAEATRYLAQYWKPLHSHAIDAVQRRDVVAVVDDIALEHGKVSADRARTALSTFFAWWIERGYLDLNPVQNIAQRASGETRTRVLRETELAAVWNACLDDDHGRIVRLLILTGQRKSEISDIDWREINVGERQIELPPERTKNGLPHLVPCSGAALAILDATPRRHGRQFVFGVGRGGFSGWSLAKKRLDSRLPGVAPWTLHDLRRTFVTLLHERGFAQPHIVEAIVNHVSGHKDGVAGVYNKASYLDERRKALDLWGAHVVGLVGAAP